MKKKDGAINISEVGREPDSKPNCPDRPVVSRTLRRSRRGKCKRVWKGGFAPVRTLVGEDGMPRVIAFLRNARESWEDLEQDRVCRKAWSLEVGEEAEEDS